MCLRLPRELGGTEYPCYAGDTRDLGSISGSGRSPGERNGNSLQYSCLGNPTGGVVWATVRGVIMSQTWLSTHTCTHTHTHTHRSTLNIFPEAVVFPSSTPTSPGQFLWSPLCPPSFSGPSSVNPHGRSSWWIQTPLPRGPLLSPRVCGSQCFKSPTGSHLAIS